MPASIAHELFGEDILSRDNTISFRTIEERDAFLLGNQGPDPLFYLFGSAQNASARKMAVEVHHESYSAFLQSMMDFLGIIRTRDLAIAQAYVCGFICHYAFDRTAHPYVHFYEDQLVHSGVKGLEDAAPEIHGQIEADLDCLMLWEMKGLDILDYHPFSDMLQADTRVLSIADKLYCFAAVGACQAILAPDTFTRAVKGMRRAQRAMYSPLGLKRVVLGKVERLARPHSLVQAMSHRGGLHGSCDWDNREHAQWVNLYTGERSTSTFMDVVSHAELVAEDDLQKFTDGKSADDMTRGVNLLGQPDEY